VREEKYNIKLKVLTTLNHRNHLMGDIKPKTRAHTLKHTKLQTLKNIKLVTKKLLIIKNNFQVQVTFS